MGKTKLFIRSSKINSAGEAIIFVRYSHGDKTTDFSTGERIEPIYWDAKNQRVRKSFKGYSGINNFIEQKRIEIDSIRIELKNQKIDPTVEAIRNKYQKASMPVVEEKSKFLLDYWPAFIKYQDEVKRLEKSTLSQYDVSKRVFETFQTHIGCRLTFDMINDSFLDDLISYGYNEKEYAPNSLGGKIKHLKAFMEWAVTKELTANIKYKKFKKPSNETTIVTLTIAQLDHLFKLDLSGEKRLEKTRDIFVLGCASGLRFSDYSVLVSANLKNDFIVISTEKMDSQVRVPINDYSKGIIAKYPGGLPTISNVNLNKYLKEVGIRAKFFEEHEITTFKKGIKQKHFKPLYSILTSHCARRTFATQSLQRGMRMVDVMKITGHKDVKSFMRYVNVALPQLKEEADRAWNTLTVATPVEKDPVSNAFFKFNFDDLKNN